MYVTIHTHFTALTSLFVSLHILHCLYLCWLDSKEMSPKLIIVCIIRSEQVIQFNIYHLLGHSMHCIQHFTILTFITVYLPLYSCCCIPYCVYSLGCVSMLGKDQDLGSTLIISMSSFIISKSALKVSLFVYFTVCVIIHYLLLYHLHQGVHHHIIVIGNSSQHTSSSLTVVS